MLIAIQLILRGLDASEAMDHYVRLRARSIANAYAHITRIEVLVDAERASPEAGARYRARMIASDASVVLVADGLARSEAYDHPYVAIDAAFTEMRRLLQQQAVARATAQTRPTTRFPAVRSSRAPNSAGTGR